jgi:hypothetical protein
LDVAQSLYYDYWPKPLRNFTGKVMPSKTPAQRRLMGAALAAKRGKKSFPEAQKIAGQMTESQLEDFARGSATKKKKGYL